METSAQETVEKPDLMGMPSSHFERYCNELVLKGLKPKVRKALILNVTTLTLGYGLSRKLDTTGLEPMEELELRKLWDDFVMGAIKDRSARDNGFNEVTFLSLLASFCEPWLKSEWGDIYSKQMAGEKNPYRLPA